MALNIVFFLISILILAVMYILLRRRIDKLTDTDRLTKAMAGDLDIILSEINQATERNVLIMEDKIKELESIIETAENRITLLKKNSETKPLSSGVPVVRKEEISEPAADKKNQLSLEIPDAAADETAAEDLTYSHLNRMATMSEMIAPLSVIEKKNQPENLNLKEQILSLYKNGIDAAIIASNVGLNLGEVELIISLYKQTNGLD